MLSQMLTATVGVQPPILDTLPGDAEDVRTSPSKKSSLNYSSLKKKKPQTKLFFFFGQNKGSTKNKQMLNTEQEPQDFFSKCPFHHLVAQADWHFHCHTDLHGCSSCNVLIFTVKQSQKHACCYINSNTVFLYTCL